MRPVSDVGSTFPAAQRGKVASLLSSCPPPPNVKQKKVKKHTHTFAKSQTVGALTLFCVSFNALVVMLLPDVRAGGDQAKGTSGLSEWSLTMHVTPQGSRE